MRLVGWEGGGGSTEEGGEGDRERELTSNGCSKVGTNSNSTSSC